MNVIHFLSAYVLLSYMNFYFWFFSSKCLIYCLAHCFVYWSFPRLSTLWIVQCVLSGITVPVMRFWFEFRSKVLSSVIGSIASKAAEAVCSHVDETKPMNAFIIGLIKDEYSSGFWLIVWHNGPKTLDRARDTLGVWLIKSVSSIF